MHPQSAGEHAERHEAISKHVGSSVTARCCSLHEPATVSGEQSHFGVVAAPLQSLHFCVTVFVHAEVIAHALATSLTPTVVGDSSDELQPTTATMNALATSALPGENTDDDDDICFTTTPSLLPDVRVANSGRTNGAPPERSAPYRDSLLVPRYLTAIGGGFRVAISQSCR